MSTILTAPHPYRPSETASLSITILDRAPGPVITAHEMDRGHATAKQIAAGWVDIAGPYCVFPGLKGTQKVFGPEAERDRSAMVAALWDLTGQPLLPGLRRRPAASICVVREAKGDALCIYRAAAEIATGLEHREKLEAKLERRAA